MSAARDHWAGLYVAQEARRAGQARHDDNVYASGQGATRFQSAAEFIDTDPRVAPQATLLELRSLTFVLPLPPSVNALYGSAPNGQKYLLPEQRQFRSAVIGIVRGVMRGPDVIAEPMAGRLSLAVTLYFANRRRTDIGNREKALSDALTHAGAFFDDSQIDEYHAIRVLRPGAEEECAVTVREIAA